MIKSFKTGILLLIIGIILGKVANDLKNKPYIKVISQDSKGKLITKIRYIKEINEFKKIYSQISPLNRLRIVNEMLKIWDAELKARKLKVFFLWLSCIGFIIGSLVIFYITPLPEKTKSKKIK